MEEQKDEEVGCCKNTKMRNFQRNRFALLNFYRTKYATDPRPKTMQHLLIKPILQGACPLPTRPRTRTPEKPIEWLPNNGFAIARETGKPHIYL